MTEDISQSLRRHQEESEPLGPFFKSLHTFADRTTDAFLDPNMPKPVLSLEKTGGAKRGFYTTQDGYGLVNRINLNPFKLRTGRDAAETLAHELVHVWQAAIGRPCRRNYHGQEFHLKMREMGIVTRGVRGLHIGYTDDGVWNAWMTHNEDLNLDQFILPGMDHEPKTKRKMIKHQCPGCGANFRNRNVLNVICVDCSEEFTIVETGSEES